MSSLSSSASTTSDSAIPTLSYNAATPSPSDHRPLIAVLTLSFFGIVAIGIILYSTYRMKPAQAPLTLEEGASQPQTPCTPSSSVSRTFTKMNRGGAGGLKRKMTGRLLDQSHAASKITPFGTSQNLSPGENMRVAMRLPNGAWTFSDPHAGLLTTDVVEQLASPTASEFSTRRSGAWGGMGNARTSGGWGGMGTGSAAGSSLSVNKLNKEEEDRAKYGKDLGIGDVHGYDDFVEMPPPAYGHDERDRERWR